VIQGEARLRGGLPRSIFGGDAGVCSSAVQEDLGGSEPA
jgi:hypothetical protein